MSEISIALFQCSPLSLITDQWSGAFLGFLLGPHNLNKYSLLQPFKEGVLQVRNNEVSGCLVHIKVNLACVLHVAVDREVAGVCQSSLLLPSDLFMETFFGVEMGSAHFSAAVCLSLTEKIAPKTIITSWLNLKDFFGQLKKNWKRGVQYLGSSKHASSVHSNPGGDLRGANRGVSSG